MLVSGKDRRAKVIVKVIVKVIIKVIVRLAAEDANSPKVQRAKELKTKDSSSTALKTEGLNDLKQKERPKQNDQNRRNDLKVKRSKLQRVEDSRRSNQRKDKNENKTRLNATRERSDRQKIN